MYAQADGRCFIFVALLMLIYVLGRALIRLLDTLSLAKEIFQLVGVSTKVAMLK